MTTKLVFGALVLGSVLALSTATAMAAPPPPNFSFGIHVGPDVAPPPPVTDSECMSTREILHQLRYAGYSNFTNFDDSGDESFLVDARRGARWYELEVDNCTGDILNRTR